jgi:hypothetical protein
MAIGLHKLSFLRLRTGAVKTALPSCPRSPNIRPCWPGVLSAAVNGIEAFPVEVQVNSGWGDTVVVLIVSISPVLKLISSPAERPATFNHFRMWDTCDGGAN